MHPVRLFPRKQVAFDAEISQYEGRIREVGLISLNGKSKCSFLGGRFAAAGSAKESGLGRPVGAVAELQG